MKKLSFFLVFAFCVNLLNAESIKLKEGWNLIGLSTATTIEELKSENSNIKQVSIYRDGFVNSGEIKPADGIWLYSDKDTQLNVKDKFLSKNEVLDESARIDKIELNAGWNLISLPINSAISPKIFKNINLIWRYSDGKWNRYGEDENSEYPKIDIIGSGEGFWVNSKEPQTIYLSDEEAKLTNFTSKAKMDEYLSAMVHYNKSYRSFQSYYYYPYYGGSTSGSTTATAPMDSNEGADGVSESSSGGASGSVKVNNATTTNLQEVGVDEADIVKNDGEKIFYLPSSWDITEIYVNTFDRVLAGESEKLTSIKLDAKPNELYLIDDKLIAIYPNNYNYWGYWESIDYSIWSESSKIEVYDVSDLNNITKINEYKIDGNIVDSRVTNNKLYLVTRFMPYVEIEYPKINVECMEYIGSTKEYISSSDDIYSYGTLKETTYLTQILTDGSIGDNIKIISTYDDNGSFLFTVTDDKGEVIESYNKEYPHYDYCYSYLKDDTGYYKLEYDNLIFKTEYLKPTIIDIEANTSKEIPTASTLYATAKFNQASFITSITSFDVSDFSNQNSVSVVGGSSTIYASNKAIYVATQEYPIYYSWRDYQERTSIYKFSITDGLSYNGKAFADGRILNQFSLSEYNDTLRVASTTGWSWRTGTDNIISTISEDNGELSVVGKLGGLGKEGETIKGVRFIGNRGFVVTFRQTDPLYTIDVSDPTNPIKVGELNITGYSSYFHPIDENRILSIGREANESGTTQGVKVELFNITDFANPISASKVTIGEDWQVSSEAENNHKAFTYRDSDNLFAIPINEYYERDSIIIDGEEYYPKYRWAYKNYLYIYQVDGMEIKKIDQVDGNATARDIYNYQRGIIFTKDSKDYGLYIAGGEMFLKEITK